jgi:hypothetical protein
LKEERFGVIWDSFLGFSVVVAGGHRGVPAAGNWK